MLKNIEAIIFDLDGSLVDSMWIWPEVDEEYFVKYGLTKPEGFYEEMEGKSYTEVAQLYLDTFPQLPCTIDEIKQEWNDMTYEKYCTEVPLKPGAREMIETLYAQGVRFGIASSNSIDLVKAVIRALGVEQYFDSIHTSCEVRTGKPAPDVYLLAARDLQIVPEHCLVFEDVPMGILAGKNAGMRVCAVDDRFSKNLEEKKRSLADYYIKDYYDIINHTYEVLV
ncbi:HAD family hydrolase [Sporofaciens sp. SGI.106]|uniref:HAD family hydrolase n=1 Tax=Sporofaciens sp. SGI.106 TaxID=3420568 RepID=UPI002AA04F23|nr:HAD family phosphatase [Lachnoclostridium sp.]